MQRMRTLDEARSTADIAATRFYAPEKISDNMSLTPEGYLLCLDVPIARTGVMEYTPRDLPAVPPAGPLILVERDEAEVFAARHITSYQGKPFVNDHPPEDVVPANWHRYAKGVILNPRRGTGEQSDFLIADILVTDPLTIQDIQDGKRDISCGYDAQYEVLGPGRAKQYEIMGNHVALVKAGRCGFECSIGDSAASGDSAMKTRDEKSTGGRLSEIAARVRQAFKAKDEGAMEEALKEAEKEGTKDEGGEGGAMNLHVHTGEGGKGALDEATEGRLAALEEGHGKIMDALTGINEKLEGMGGAGKKETEAADAEAEAVEEEMEGETTGDSGKMRDAAISAIKSKSSASLSAAYMAAVAGAEILFPGIRLPMKAFDASMHPVDMAKSICTLRRNALDRAYLNPHDRDMIEELNGGKPLALTGMKCPEVKRLFGSAVVAKKQANRAGAGRQTTNDTRGAVVDKKDAPLDLSDLNARNAKYWATQQQ